MKGLFFFFFLWMKWDMIYVGFFLELLGSEDQKILKKKGAGIDLFFKRMPIHLRVGKNWPEA